MTEWGGSNKKTVAYSIELLVIESVMEGCLRVPILDGQEQGLCCESAGFGERVDESNVACEE